MKERTYTEKPIHAVAFDFDNTLCKSAFNPKTGKYDMGEPIDPVCNFATEQSWDNEVIIFTARPKSEWGQVRAWLDSQAVRYHRIVKKPLARFYMDDRAMRPSDIWKEQDRT